MGDRAVVCGFQGEGPDNLVRSTSRRKPFSNRKKGEGRIDSEGEAALLESHFQQEIVNQSVGIVSEVLPRFALLATGWGRVRHC